MTNVIVVEGYITSQGTELRSVGETSLLKFSITNPIKKGKTDHMNFFQCEMWGKFAQVMSEHLGPKTRLTVVGQMIQDRWESEDGQKKSAMKIRVNEMSFGGKSSEFTTSSDKPKEDVAPWEKDNKFDDDIPF